MENSEIQSVIDKAKQGIGAAFEEIQGCKAAIKVLEDRIKVLRIDIDSRKNIVNGYAKKLTTPQGSKQK